MCERCCCSVLTLVITQLANCNWCLPCLTAGGCRGAARARWVGSRGGRGAGGAAGGDCL